jgi:molybdopterin converting factor small subunit
MSGFSAMEMALAQFVKMDSRPLKEYQELCEQVIGLLDQQKPDNMGNIYVPKNTIGKVLATSKMMAISMLSIKTAMAVESPLPEIETILACKRFIEGAKAPLRAGDIVYFLPRSCPFGDVPPGVPFIVADICPTENEDEPYNFPAKYAVELAFLDKDGTIRTAAVDKRRISKEKHEPSAMIYAPETTMVS